MQSADGRLSAVLVSFAFVGVSVAASQQRVVQPMKPTGLFLPLAHARQFGGAEIVANNNGPEAQSVSVSWIADGQQVDAAPLELGAQASVVKPLADLMPSGVTLGNVEGLVLRFQGHAVDQIVAQVTLLPRDPDGPSQSLDLTPVVPFDFKSTRLDAVWSTPNRNEHAVVVLSNVTNGTVTGRVRGPAGAEDFKLLPLGHVVITRETGPNASVDWLEVSSDGPIGAVAATGFAWSPADRVPVQLRFLDPAAGAQSDVYAAGLRVGGAIRLALANTSEASIMATPEFLDAATGDVLKALPAVFIQPHSGVAVNTGSLITQWAEPGTVSVRVRSTGVRGSLVASLRSFDPLSKLWLDVPLHNAGTDAGTARRGTGNAPWRLDGDYETRLVLVNAGEDSATFSVRIHHDDVDNAARMPPIVLGATKILDLRRWRDAGRGEGFPKPLASDSMRGLVWWSVFPPAPTSYLVGRAEIISSSRRVSSSYTW